MSSSKPRTPSTTAVPTMIESMCLVEVAHDSLSAAVLPVQEGCCAFGDHCPYAHNVFEYWLHPTRWVLGHGAGLEGVVGWVHDCTALKSEWPVWEWPAACIGICLYHTMPPAGPPPPLRYRTQLCNDGSNCKRKICFFAHRCGLAARAWSLYVRHWPLPAVRVVASQLWQACRTAARQATI